MTDEADHWYGRTISQRKKLVATALDLARIEEEIANTFTVIAATSPDRAGHLLEQANVARVTASKQRALARRYDSL